MDYDQDPAANACKIPMVYLSTDVPSVRAGGFLEPFTGIVPSTRHREDAARGPLQHDRSGRSGQCDDRTIPGRWRL